MQRTILQKNQGNRLMLIFQKKYMRILLTLLCILPLAALSQDCTLRRNTNDVITQPNVSTGFIQLQGGKVNISGTKTEIEFFFIVDKGKTACFSDDSPSNIAFEGMRMQTRIRNSGTTNCEGVYNMIFKTATSIPGNLQRMTERKVTSFIFTDRNEKQINVMLTAKQQELLMKVIKCIIEERGKLK